MAIVHCWLRLMENPTIFTQSYISVDLKSVGSLGYRFKSDFKQMYCY